MRNFGRAFTAISIPVFIAVFAAVGKHTHGAMFELGVLTMVLLPVGPIIWITGAKQKRLSNRRTKDV